MKIIYLTQGQVAMVDDEDFEHLNQWRWCAHKEKGGANYYACRTDTTGDKRTFIKMHRHLMKPPRNMVVDHKDGNGLNNQKINLRVCTHSQNSMNQISRKRKSSKYKGVNISVVKRKALCRDTGLMITHVYVYWIALVTHGGKRVHVGNFKNEIDAAKAYNEAAAKYHGEFARLNTFD